MMSHLDQRMKRPNPEVKHQVALSEKYPPEMVYCWLVVVVNAAGDLAVLFQGGEELAPVEVEGYYW